MMPSTSARRRLMLQSLAQFCVALLDLLEQPHVLDGDDGLGGEGLEQLDLLVGERTNFRSANHNRPDGSTLPQQRRGKYSARSTDSDGGPWTPEIRFRTPPLCHGRESSVRSSIALPGRRRPRVWEYLPPSAASEESTRTTLRLNEAPINAERSRHPLRRIAARHFPPPRQAPAEYPSASWQLRPRFHSSPFAAPTIP